MTMPITSTTGSIRPDEHIAAGGVHLATACVLTLTLVSFLWLSPAVTTTLVSWVAEGILVLVICLSLAIVLWLLITPLDPSPEEVALLLESGGLRQLLSQTVRETRLGGIRSSIRARDLLRESLAEYCRQYLGRDHDEVPTRLSLRVELVLRKVGSQDGADLPDIERITRRSSRPSRGTIRSYVSTLSELSHYLPGGRVFVLGVRTDMFGQAVPDVELGDKIHSRLEALRRERTEESHWRRRARWLPRAVRPAWPLAKLLCLTALVFLLVLLLTGLNILASLGAAAPFALLTAVRTLAVCRDVARNLKWWWRDRQYLTDDELLDREVSPVRREREGREKHGP